MKGHLIPEIFTDGDIDRLKRAIMDAAHRKANCIGEHFCEDISNDDCQKDRCILYAGSLAETEFVEDPIQWIVDKGFITKAQGLDMILTN